MKKSLNGLVVLLLFAGTVGVTRAQDETKTTHKSTRTLTGCLQKGDSANEYLLTTQKGNTWEIKSDSVNLGEHVGHTVAITGAVSHAKMHGMKEDAKEDANKNATEHGHMTVTDLKMVSDSCTQ